MASWLCNSVGFLPRSTLCGTSDTPRLNNRNWHTRAGLESQIGGAGLGAAMRATAAGWATLWRKAESYSLRPVAYQEFRLDLTL